MSTYDQNKEAREAHAAAEKAADGQVGSRLVRQITEAVLEVSRRHTMAGRILPVKSVAKVAAAKKAGFGAKAKAAVKPKKKAKK